MKFRKLIRNWGEIRDTIDKGNMEQARNEFENAALGHQILNQILEQMLVEENRGSFYKPFVPSREGGYNPKENSPFFCIWVTL